MPNHVIFTKLMTLGHEAGNPKELQTLLSDYYFGQKKALPVYADAHVKNPLNIRSKG